MAVNKCPLCGSRTLNGTCNECGYSAPDETEISSMYNYDPDDDEFGEKSAYPTAQEQEDAMPEMRVREEVQRNYQNPYKYKNRTPNIQVVKPNNIQVQAPQQPQQQPRNSVNPYANFSPVNNQQQGTPNFNTASNPDPKFKKDLGIGIFLAMLIPIVGIFCGVRFINKYKTTKDVNYLIAGIVIFVLSAFRFLF